MESEGLESRNSTLKPIEAYEKLGGNVLSSYTIEIIMILVAATLYTSKKLSIYDLKIWLWTSV